MTKNSKLKQHRNKINRNLQFEYFIYDIVDGNVIITKLVIVKVENKVSKKEKRLLFRTEA